MAAANVGRGDDCVNENFPPSVGPNNFQKLAFLGTGGFSRVYLSKKQAGFDHGRRYAFKEIAKDKVVRSPKSMEHARTEREVLEKVKGCPFLVQLAYAFQTKKYLAMVMDLVEGGELCYYLRTAGPFSENTVRIYAAELVLALDTIHKLGYVYRDLKPENILIDREGHIVLADLGLCKDISTGIGRRRTFSFCGTLVYMAPEMAWQGGHSFEVDFWSLGIVMYEMLTGSVPNKRAKKDTAFSFARRMANFPNTPAFLAKETDNILRRFLEPNASLRLGSNGFGEIKSHAFFNEINWHDVESKKITPPLSPRLIEMNDASPADVMMLDATYDREVPLGHRQDVIVFQNFSYVAPELLNEPAPGGASGVNEEVRVDAQGPSGTDCAAAGNDFMRMHAMLDEMEVSASKRVNV